MKKYFFFICNAGNEALLKEEIKVYYPWLNLSFSKKRFLTYTSQKEVEDNFFNNNQIMFATFCGISLGNIKKINLNQTISELKPTHIQVCNLNEERESPEELKKLESIKEKIKIGDLILYLWHFGEETWAGYTLANKNKLNYFTTNSPINLPAESPSRAYLKIAEAFDLLKPKINTNSKILEFGCAPGGASYFLIQNNFNVLGVDPGEMDHKVIASPFFKHIKKSIYELNPNEIENNFDWLIIDMNLPMTDSVAQTMKFAKHLKNLNGILFTVKVPKIELVKKLKKLADNCAQLLHLNFLILQLPSHKNEILFYFYKKQ